MPGGGGAPELAGDGGWPEERGMRLVVGISGSSGAIYGIRLLEALRKVSDLETHLIISAAGKRTILEETDYALKDVEALATRVYDKRDIGAALTRDRESGGE